MLVQLSLCIDQRYGVSSMTTSLLVKNLFLHIVPLVFLQVHSYVHNYF